jgi:integrase
MNYAEASKSKGIKLELSTFRDHWRKSINGQMKYFRHPQTKAGYEAALQEMFLLKAQIDGSRPHIGTYKHHLQLFNSCLAYYDAFGVPLTERKLHRQIQQLVEVINDQLQQPTLQQKIDVNEFLLRNKEFNQEFVPADNVRVETLSTDQIGLWIDPTYFGQLEYQLPNKWLDRIARMTPEATDKKPQTVQYWYDDYFRDMEKKHDSNQITDSTYADRKYALSSFKKFVDLQSHITTLGNGLLDKYDDSLQSNKQLKRKSKQSYMKTAKMFVRYCKLAVDCDLTEAPLLEKTYKYIDHQGTGRTRQQKKLLLWSKDDFDKALQLPEPYRCYCLLFLNCGFRHIDLSYLQHIDIDNANKRIVIQRHKLNKLDTAPVINYKLWDATWEALEECKRSTGKLVFGSVHDAFKQWWKRNGIGMRLDYLRKTGSTTVDQYSNGISEMYTGDCLTTTARIHYSFNDGEVNPTLDKATDYLGNKFGLCEAPTKTVELTDEIIEALQKMGVILPKQNENLW